MKPGLNEIFNGIFVGDARSAFNQELVDSKDITHIVQIMCEPTPALENKYYLCVMAMDLDKENLIQYVPACNDFIHEARIHGSNILIHCYAGKSRSITIAIAYILTITNLSCRDVYQLIKYKRPEAHPNISFLRQLNNFQTNFLIYERNRLQSKYPNNRLKQSDIKQSESILKYLKINQLEFPRRPYSLYHSFSMFETLKKRYKFKREMAATMAAATASVAASAASAASGASAKENSSGESTVSGASDQKENSQIIDKFSLLSAEAYNMAKHRQGKEVMMNVWLYTPVNHNDTDDGNGNGNNDNDNNVSNDNNEDEIPKKETDQPSSSQEEELPVIQNQSNEDPNPSL